MATEYRIPPTELRATPLSPRLESCTFPKRKKPSAVVSSALRLPTTSVVTAELSCVHRKSTKESAPDWG